MIDILKTWRYYESVSFFVSKETQAKTKPNTPMQNGMSEIRVSRICL